MSQFLDKMKVSSGSVWPFMLGLCIFFALLWIAGTVQSAAKYALHAANYAQEASEHAEEAARSAKEAAESAMKAADEADNASNDASDAADSCRRR